jgi:putative intracellular protease/amidase
MLPAALLFQSCAAAPAMVEAGAASGSNGTIRAGVLSKEAEPGKDTSQACYIRILRNAGMQARAVSAEEIKAGALDQFDIFIIGGGSGTKFNASLGPEGGHLVEDFVRKGGGTLGSCAGGYSFVRGHNEALRHIEIANARCIDVVHGRWARGAAVVEIAPEGDGVPVRKMYYANGPLWEIRSEPGFGLTKSLAHFVSDVKKKDDPGGVMPGTPAILGGTFGRGRFVLFSGHPEFYRKLGNNPLVVDAARWVVRGPLAPGEKIEWRAVFPDTIGDGPPGSDHEAG